MHAHRQNPPPSPECSVRQINMNKIAEKLNERRNQWATASEWSVSVRLVDVVQKFNSKNSLASNGRHTKRNQIKPTRKNAAAAAPQND